MNKKRTRPENVNRSNKVNINQRNSEDAKFQISKQNLQTEASQTEYKIWKNISHRRHNRRN